MFPFSTAEKKKHIDRNYCVFLYHTGKWTPSRAQEMEDLEIKDKRNLLILSH